MIIIDQNIEDDIIKKKYYLYHKLDVKGVKDDNLFRIEIITIGIYS